MKFRQIWSHCIRSGKAAFCDVIDRPSDVNAFGRYFEDKNNRYPVVKSSRVPAVSCTFKAWQYVAYSIELFSRKRWQLISAQLSIKFGYWPSSLLFWHFITTTADTSLHRQLAVPRLHIWNVGPILTKFWIDRMAFGQPERTCLNIQNVPLL